MRLSAKQEAPSSVGGSTFTLHPDTICIDIQATEKEELYAIFTSALGGLPKQIQDMNQTPTLKEVAKVLLVKLPEEGSFHVSKFDAIVTLRIFKVLLHKLFLDKGLAYFKGVDNPAIERDFRLMNSSTDTNEKEEETSIMAKEERWKNTELNSYGNGFHEALLYKSGYAYNEKKVILVRLDDSEAECLHMIHQINPDYALSDYYFDVILPGRKAKIEKAIAKAENSVCYVPENEPDETDEPGERQNYEEGKLDKAHDFTPIPYVHGPDMNTPECLDPKPSFKTGIGFEEGSREKEPWEDDSPLEEENLELLGTEPDCPEQPY